MNPLLEKILNPFVNINLLIPSVVCVEKMYKETFSITVELFRELWNGEPIRLLGIRTSKLVDEKAPEQMSIFDYQQELVSENRSTYTKSVSARNEKHAKLDKTMDEIRKKYGKDAIKRGPIS